MYVHIGRLLSSYMHASQMHSIFKCIHSIGVAMAVTKRFCKITKVKNYSKASTIEIRASLQLLLINCAICSHQTDWPCFPTLACPCNRAHLVLHVTWECSHRPPMILSLIWECSCRVHLTWECSYTLYTSHESAHVEYTSRESAHVHYTPHMRVLM